MDFSLWQRFKYSFNRTSNIIQVRMGAAETFIVLAQENIRIYELYFIQIIQFEKKILYEKWKNV